MLSPAEDPEYLANQAAGYESYRSMNLKRTAQGVRAIHSERPAGAQRLKRNPIRWWFGRALRPICSIHEIIELLLNRTDVGFCALKIRP